MNEVVRKTYRFRITSFNICLGRLALSLTTLRKGIYAFIFDKKGLMAGIGLRGSKFTRITPDE